jgi:signal transduction histidine kinase
MAEAAQRVIPVIAQTIGWDLAEIYMVNEESEMLERIEVWHSQKSKLRTHSVEKARLFKKGQGLPGHVWMSGRAAWIDNIQARALINTPVDNSVVAALCLPISAQNSFLGVLMFCSSKITRPDKDSLDLLTSLCTQIGQFMQRLKDQEARQHLLLVKQKEDFIATLAHDLKTPLVSADRILELMTNGALGKLEPNQAEILSKLRESNNALLRMVQNLLALYRYESGVEALFVERTNFYALATTCAAEIRPVADNKKIKISVDVSEAMDPVYVDSIAMRRVITNLLSNAIKFTNEGGAIKLTAKLIENGSLLKLEVEDSGVGVAPDDLEHLFKRFWQGNQKNRAIGTGLGLHLCLNIVQAHKGTITCNSEVGKGTKFTIVIPAKLQEGEGVAGETRSDTTSPLPLVTMPGDALTN